MDYTFESEIGWNSVDANNHRIELDIQVDLPNVLQARNLAVELGLNQQYIRADIHRIFTEEILPKIIAKTAVPSALPEGQLETHSKTKIRGSASVGEKKNAGNITVSVQDRINVIMSITTDRSVNAMQALRGSIGDLADSLTNDVMSHLRFKYLGQEKSTYESTSTLEDGNVIDSRVKYEGDSSNQN